MAHASATVDILATRDTVLVVPTRPSGVKRLLLVFTYAVKTQSMILRGVPASATLVMACRTTSARFVPKTTSSATGTVSLVPSTLT